LGHSPQRKRWGDTPAGGRDIGVKIGRAPNKVLILRRPRSGRLEEWTAQEIGGKAAVATSDLLPTLRDAALRAAPQGKVPLHFGAPWGGGVISCTHDVSSYGQRPRNLEQEDVDERFDRGS